MNPEALVRHNLEGGECMSLRARFESSLPVPKCSTPGVFEDKAMISQRPSQAALLTLPLGPLIAYFAHGF